MPTILDLRRGQVVGDASRRAVNLNTVSRAVANATYAPIASPSFTGDPKAPTPAPGDNDTSVATTAFVHTAVAAAGGITQLTGDAAAGPGSGSQPLTLAAVNGNVGTFQGLTLDGKGRVTAAADQGYATSAAMSTADNLRVLKAGDTMTGPLVLPVGTVAATSLNFGGPGTGLLGVATNDQIIISVGGGAKLTLATNAITGTSPIRQGNGSVTSPSFSFTSTTSAGLWRSGTNQVSMATAGIETMRWNADNSTLATGIFGASGGIACGSYAGTAPGPGGLIVSGAAGFGLSGPNYQLQVIGPAAAGGTASAIGGGPAGADTTSKLLVFTDAGQAAAVGGITRNGTNTVAYGTASDERLKSDIVESGIGVEALMALRVREYRMGEGRQHGLIAQEVASVYPAAVFEGGDDPATDPWLLDYGRLTPLLIRTVQQQQAVIEWLESRLARLEAAGA